ncbi:MAG: hypothetical protein JWP97_3299 [Labilithrix sp.]|nr:hypothetical protein [Labilithrix sp.]
MRRGTAVRLGVLAAASLAAACSVLTGLDGDYTLASEVSADDGAVDGGSEAAADVTPPIDAPIGVDGGTFCERHDGDPGVVFCHDFEKSGSAPANGFDQTASDEGSFDVSLGTGVGGSMALRAKANHPAASSNVYFRKVFTEADGAAPSFDGFNEHELSFAFTAEQQTSLYTAVIGSLGYGVASSPKRVGVSVYRGVLGKSSFDVSDPPGGMAGSFVSVPLGTWRRARISLKRPAALQPYQVVVEIAELDGSDPVEVYRDVAFGGAVLADGGTGPAQILLGAFFTSPDVPDAGPDGGVTTIVDDVLYRRVK